MARYERILPMVDSRENTFPKIQQLMKSKKFKYENRDGEMVFRKGDGVWLLGRFVKVTYTGSSVRIQAWVNSMGNEMDLEGFVGSAGKKPLRKLVNQIEQILSVPAAGYTPQAVEEPPFAAAGNMPVEEKLPEGVTKAEYFKKYAPESFAKNIKTTAIIGYACAGINALLSVAVNPLGLIDSVIFLGLTLGVHLGKSKGCAIGMLVYAIFTVVLGLVLTGTLSGWLWIIAGASAVSVFSNAEKRYKELTNT